MIGDKYAVSVGRIAWGYFFLYFSLDMGTIDIIPAWAGFLFIYKALDAVAELEPSAQLLKSFALLLSAESVAEWVVKIFSLDVSFYWIEIIASVVTLYFHFQLLTNLAQIAEQQGFSMAKKLKRLRSAQTVFLTITAVVPLNGEKAVTISQNGIVMFLFAVVNIVVMLGICITLFNYKKELRAITVDQL